MVLSACYELNFCGRYFQPAWNMRISMWATSKKIVPVGGADLKKGLIFQAFLLQRCVSLVEFSKVSYFEVQILEAFKNLKA